MLMNADGCPLQIHYQHWADYGSFNCPFESTTSLYEYSFALWTSPEHPTASNGYQYQQLSATGENHNNKDNNIIKNINNSSNKNKHNNNDKNNNSIGSRKITKHNTTSKTVDYNDHDAQHHRHYQHQQKQWFELQCVKIGCWNPKNRGLRGPLAAAARPQNLWAPPVNRQSALGAKTVCRDILCKLVASNWRRVCISLSMLLRS